MNGNLILPIGERGIEKTTFSYASSVMLCRSNPNTKINSSYFGNSKVLSFNDALQTTESDT